MTACGSEQTPRGGTALVCVCDTDGSCHIHETAGGTRFIGALNGVLVLRTPATQPERSRP